MELYKDEEIMSRVQSGDLQALSVIFNRYQVKIYNFFYRMCYDREVCRDLTQNVFEKVIRYRDSFDVQKTFKSWLFQIARNLYRDYYHANKAAMKDIASIQYVADNAFSGLEKMEQEQQHAQLYEALNQLPDDKRELMIMSRLMGMKYEEISEATGTSVSAIKVKMHRAMRLLRKIYFELD